MEQPALFDEQDREKDFSALIRELSGNNSVTIPKIYIRAMESLEGGAFLNQLVFWSDKGKGADGWFYKSVKEWEREVFLNRYQVDKWGDYCVEQGFLEVKLQKAKGAPTRHYRFDMAKFMRWICRNQQNLDLSKSANGFAEISKTYKQKITTEEYTEAERTRLLPVDAGETSNQPPNAEQFWRLNVGTLRPASIKVINELCARYTEELVVRAMQEAVIRNTKKMPTLNFVAAICKGMKAQEENSEQRRRYLAEPETIALNTSFEIVPDAALEKLRAMALGEKP